MLEVKAKAKNDALSSPTSVSAAAARSKVKGNQRPASEDRLMMLTAFCSLMAGVKVEQNVWEQLCISLANTLGENVISTDDLLGAKGGPPSLLTEEANDATAKAMRRKITTVQLHIQRLALPVLWRILLKRSRMMRPLICLPGLMNRTFTDRTQHTPFSTRALPDQLNLPT